VGKSLSYGKSFDISKWEVWEAYRRVKANKGAPGVDGQTIEAFETDLKKSVPGVEPNGVGVLHPSCGACGANSEG
jgi:hypothetical protein